MKCPRSGAHRESSATGMPNPNSVAGSGNCPSTQQRRLFGFGVGVGAVLTLRAKVGIKVDPDQNMIRLGSVPVVTEQ